MKWNSVYAVFIVVVYVWFVVTVMTSVIARHGMLTVIVIGVLVGPVFLGSFLRHPEIRNLLEDKDPTKPESRIRKKD